MTIKAQEPAGEGEGREPVFERGREVPGGPAEPVVTGKDQAEDEGNVREATGEDAHRLADALDRFFYDLHFTAPEAWGDRVGQLGHRIRETMTAIGYPKKGR